MQNTIFVCVLACVCGVCVIMWEVYTYIHVYCIHNQYSQRPDAAAEYPALLICLILLRQGLSLDLELGCQPLSPSNPLVSSHCMTNLSLGKHNTQIYLVQIEIPRQTKIRIVQLGKSYWYGKVWISGCTYKSRNDSKTAASPRPPPHDWQRTKIGKSVVHGTAFRKLNKLVCLFQVTLV